MFCDINKVARYLPIENDKCILVKLMNNPSERLTLEMGISKWEEKSFLNSTRLVLANWTNAKSFWYFFMVLFFCNLIPKNKLPIMCRSRKHTHLKRNCKISISFFFIFNSFGNDCGGQPLKAGLVVEAKQ